MINSVPCSRWNGELPKTIEVVSIGVIMHPLQSAYDFLMEELKAKLVEVSEAKKTLNQLAKKMNITIPFPDVVVEKLNTSDVSVTTRIRDSYLK